MRLGIVQGRIVLSRCVPILEGTRFLIVEPVTAKNLAAGNGKGGLREVVVADRLGPGLGQMVGFVEGREASNPWYPYRAPVDACCSLIVDTLDYKEHSPHREGKIQ